MEKNVGQVAQEVTSMVHDEPGPAENFVKCYVTTCDIHFQIGEMFLEYQKGLVKFPASNYVTFASKVESVVVRLSAFQGHSLIIKDLDFTTYLWI